MNLFLTALTRGPHNPEFGWTAKQVTVKNHVYLVGSAGWVRVRYMVGKRECWRELKRKGPSAIAARYASGWFQ